jgi:3-oxo-5-alpha-steroid 4-dehydrogenase 1
MGTYLSSPEARFYLRDAFGSVRFWSGVGLGIVGFVGNVVHDEILFELGARRRRVPPALLLRRRKQRHSKKNTMYAIPHGYLYKYISYPNYLCEWLEWLGFTLAAAPLPYPLNPSSPPTIVIAPPWIFLLGEVLLMAPRGL